MREPSVRVRTHVSVTVFDTLYACPVSSSVHRRGVCLCVYLCPLCDNVSCGWVRASIHDDSDMAPWREREVQERARACAEVNERPLAKSGRTHPLGPTGLKMAATAPSRAVLSRWATETLGEPIGAAPEKKCANGVIYCQLLDALRPGVLNMSKVNLAADAAHTSLGNYRLLATGLEKAGIENPIDTSLLAKGQPSATLELLHRLYALSGEHTQTKPAKGLAPLDANAIEVEGGRRGGKRRAGAAPSATSASKRPSRKKGDESAEEPPPAPTPEAGASAAPVAVAEAAPSVVAVLRRQLEEARCDASAARSEAGFLMEERDFYMTKLECIQDACTSVPAEELAQAVIRLLGADEEEIGAAAAAIV